MKMPSTNEISKNFDLWQEYMDPDGTMSNDEFHALTIEEKNAIQKSCFPNECNDIED